MPADLVRNDPSQTVPASNATVDAIHSFAAVINGGAETLEYSPASEGAFKQATIKYAAELRAAAQEYTARTSPKLEYIRTAAEDATRVGDEGAGSLNAVDVTIA